MSQRAAANIVLSDDDWRLAAERVMRRVVLTEATGCLMWQGPPNTSGYGNVAFRGRTLICHRVTFSAVNGQIPEGLTLDHLCHTQSDCDGSAKCPHRLCVNPLHLEVVTTEENSRRQWSARKPACIAGHPFDERNTYYYANGRRACRACNRRRVRELKERQMMRAAAVPFDVERVA